MTLITKTFSNINKHDEIAKLDKWGQKSFHTDSNDHSLTLTRGQKYEVLLERKKVMRLTTILWTKKFEDK